MIRRWLYRLAWPGYDCTDCIGMIQHGCYCSAMGAVAPGCGPEKWRLLLRKLLHG